MRTAEVLSADNSGWLVLKGWIDSATHKVEVLPVDTKLAGEALYQTQVTSHSIMGAVIYNTGGILIDGGWIRILGSGGTKLNRSLPGWNKGKTFAEYGERPGFLLVADDVLGGFFAINGGALGNDPGQLYYLAPEKLEWEDLKMGYSDFKNFCFNGNLNKFYEMQRWSGWKNDIANLSGNQGFLFYPYLWTVEGKDISKTRRSVVPIEELYLAKSNVIKQFSH